VQKWGCMKNLLDEKKIAACKDDLDLRLYTIKLLVEESELVLHGMGSWSVKTSLENESSLCMIGDVEKSDGLRKEDFLCVELEKLLALVKDEKFDSSKMKKEESMFLLHALIPYKFVDFTHADAILTLSNAVTGKETIQKLFENFLVIDYVTPGVDMVQAVYAMSKDVDWKNVGGIIIHNYGIFTFGESAQESYNKLIEAVTKAEEFLDENASVAIERSYVHSECDIAKITRVLSAAKGYDVSLNINQTPLASFYASQDNLKAFASRGVLVPEHIAYTKRAPLVMEDTDLEGGLKKYMQEYKAYFQKYATDEVMHNGAPEYMIIKNLAVISFGKDKQEAAKINDIVEHTMLAVLRADKLGGFESISEKDSFALEYRK